MAAVMMFGAASPAAAQLTGSKNIPGDYADVKSAIIDLNAQGVGAGGVTFNLSGGSFETFTSPTDGVINLPAGFGGTAANQIIFTTGGSGAYEIAAATGTVDGVAATAASPGDAIITLVGTDYVTFDGVDLYDGPATGNNTTTKAMEYGLLMVRTGSGATLDGCNNNTSKTASSRCSAGWVRA